MGCDKNKHSRVEFLKIGKFAVTLRSDRKLKSSRLFKTKFLIVYWLAAFREDGCRPIGFYRDYSNFICLANLHIIKNFLLPLHPTMVALLTEPNREPQTNRNNYFILSIFMIKISYRVYLFTRPPKPKEGNKSERPSKLRVQVIANGKTHFATFPLLVRDFTKYYNSDGTLKEGCAAVSLKEKFERDCIAAAYQASCRAAEYMLGISPDYWRLAPTSYFTEVVNSEYDCICDGYKRSDCPIANRVKEDKEREANNCVPLWREYLDDWRFAAGEGPEPPQWFGSHRNYEAWKEYMEEDKA